MCMYYNLNNPIAKRETKTVYKDVNKTIKLFVPNYSKSDILNEALNQARVETTGLNIFAKAEFLNPTFFLDFTFL